MGFQSGKMENDRRASRGDVERYDLEILLRRPSLRSNLPKRVAQICREEVSSGETVCGVGCIRGQWIQSFANRNSFTFIYGILGSFYGSYYAYFYGVITTLEKRFKISSQTIGVIATLGDVAQVLTCFIISLCMPRAHRPKCIALGVFLMAASTVIFALPHFLYEPEEPRRMLITRHSNSVQDCTDGSHTCSENLERLIPVAFLILAQILHGIGGSFYFMVGRSYEEDNIERYKPPALLSLLSVLKILGPAFGYWLSSISLKFFEYPELRPHVDEGDPRWTGAWWLGSLVIGFMLIVPGFLIGLFPSTLPKTVVKRIQNKLNEVPGPRRISTKRKVTFKRFFKSLVTSCTHFAAVFNLLGFLGYFIFLPKYVETQYRVSASNANFIAGSVTLISSAVGIVTANSVITRYRPSARILASWTAVVGIISIGGLVSYIFLDCPANDKGVNEMLSQNPEILCRCVNSSFFPVCDEDKQAFISFCHAGCDSTNINITKGYESCRHTELPTANRKVFEGFCPEDCHSNFLKFIIITCSITFLYATGRTSNYWFEIKTEEVQEKPTTHLGMILGLVASVPVPVVFGYLLDQACLLWEGNCEWSRNCWLYDNERLRFSMNLTAVGFAVIGIVFDVGIWFSVKNLELFEDIDYFFDEIEEK